jgi:hypothetical protein
VPVPPGNKLTGLRRTQRVPGPSRAEDGSGRNRQVTLNHPGVTEVTPGLSRGWSGGWAVVVVGAPNANVKAIDGVIDFGKATVEIDGVQDPAAEQTTESLGAGFDEGDLLPDLAAEAVVNRAGAHEWQVAIVSATGHRGILAHPCIRIAVDPWPVSPNGRAFKPYTARHTRGTHIISLSGFGLDRHTAQMPAGHRPDRWDVERMERP